MLAWTQNIAYDGFGNITTKSVPSGSAEPAFPGVVSSKNWLAGVSYDANGNALGVNAFALTYDMENRLATATSGTAVESYAYDEANHRVEKTSGFGDFLYFYGPDGRLLSIRQVQKVGSTWTTSVIADRVYFGGMLLGLAATTGFGDVSTLTDRLGTAVAGYPYGTDVGSVTAGNDQPDFATYTKDGTTGFEYAMNRYYSAGLGRFLSVDPYGKSAHAGFPLSWNRYSYTAGDPLNYTDPSGNDMCAGAGGSAGDYSYGQTHCMSYEAQQGAPPDSDPTNAIGLAVGAMTGLALDFPADFEPGGGGPTGPPAPPPDCGQEFSLSSQPEAQEIAVLFGEDSWNLPVYSYDAVSMEDLYMLQAMYNQAKGNHTIDPSPSYVASTINSNTYRGYVPGINLLEATFSESVSSNDCNHLVSAEATYATFWDGNLAFSNVNVWRAANQHGPQTWGQVQIAGSVFWYQPNTVVSPHHHAPIVRLPGRP